MWFLTTLPPQASLDYTIRRVLDAWGPLRHPLFRILWIANLTSNVGTWLQEVAGAWLMTSLAPTPLMVGLVRASWTLPVFVLALPAGALADILDRRRFLIGTQLWMLGSAACLAITTYLGLITPWLLLLFTFSLGVGVSMNAPAWQALIPELVPREELHSAVTLGSISFNIARAVGPALGGLVIALAGPEFAFLLNALSFLAVVVVLARWKRTPKKTYLEAEGLWAAMGTGLSYVRRSPAFLAILVRVAVLILCASALSALLPLIARLQLQQGASGYGILVGLFGIGALGAGAAVPRLRRLISLEALVALATVLFAVVEIGLSAVHNFYLAAVGLLLAGGAWLTLLSSFNTAAQSMLPSWVRARALSIYLLVFFGGMAVGSASWGFIANQLGLATALVLSGCSLVLSLGMARLYRLPSEREADPNLPDQAEGMNVNTG